MTGVILLDKPEGVTSFWAAAQLRRVCGEKKIGHTGTLDPMASGLLPVLLGGATKFADLLPTVLTRFRGRITQTPPMYSAVSQNGVRLYALARQGIEVERKTREVEIYRLELTDADEVKGAYTIDVRCSGGTYIRSLVSDLGNALGCGAVLTALRRTEANGLSVENAHTLDELRGYSPQTLCACVLPMDAVLAAYPAVTVTQNQSVRFRNGGALDLGRVRGVGTQEMYRVYDPQGKFLGLGQRSTEKNELAVRRLLIER